MCRRPRARPRNNGHSWKCWDRDLKAVGIAHQRHYESRATFISLAEGAGADPEMIARITHASLHGAKDLYRRARLYWPRMCDAVRCIRVPRPRQVTGGPGGPGSSRESGGGEPGETGEPHAKTGGNEALAPRLRSPCPAASGSYRTCAPLSASARPRAIRNDAQR